MSRLCWSTRDERVYLAIGKGCFGFAPSDSALTHLWSYEGFLEDTRVVVEGASGLLAVSSGRSIHIIDPLSPVKPRVSWLDAHKDTIYALHFTETGLLFSSGKDCCVKVWEIESEELSLFGSKPEAHRSCVLGLQFNAASRLLITAGMDGLLRVWRLENTGAFLPLATSEQAQKEGILSLSTNLESNISITGGCDGSLRIWRFQPGALHMLACEGEVHQGWVRCLQFDAPSGLVISSGDDGDIRVFQFKEEQLFRLSAVGAAHSSGILGLQLCMKSKCLLSAGEDGAIKIWSLNAGTLTFQASVESAHDGGAVSQLQFDPARKLLVSAGSDKRIRAWLFSPKVNGLLQIASAVQAQLASPPAFLACAQKNPEPSGGRPPAERSPMARRVLGRALRARHLVLSFSVLLTAAPCFARPRFTALRAEPDEVREAIRQMRAREMKRELEAAGVNAADLFEKEELAERLWQLRTGAIQGAPAAEPAADVAPEPDPKDPKAREEWSGQVR
ncbi:unnamed protein product [Effrenium voratum]|nr:unnamed protein product [Effrenium voratum]